MTRSTRDLLNILEKKKVRLQVLDQRIDTAPPTGMLVVTMLGAIAAFENVLRKNRQAAGIAMAKRNGVKLDRKKA